MIRESGDGPSRIGTLNEKPLHAALKEWYADGNDRFEVPVDGYLIDIVRGRCLIEIQTRAFAAIKRKLFKLTKRHPVRLIHQIAREKWIVRLSRHEDVPLGRRKSPKRGSLLDVFGELVSFPGLLIDPNFSLEVLLIHEEEVRRQDGTHRAWRRRGWVTQERRLLRVLDRHLFETPSDLAALLPADLPEPFTTADLAAAIEKPRHLAGQMAYCLREMRVIAPVGKRGNAILYRHSESGT